VNALLHRANRLSSGFGADRPGIVHRLDKDTSGLIVIAKTDSAHRHLAQQFKNKTAHRVYWAICFGKFKTAKGTITSYLKRHPTDRKKFASEKPVKTKLHTGKLAITHYQVIETLPSRLTLLHLKLETGRTHQIRVHLSEAGHALLADPIYSSSNKDKSLHFPRLALHAAELGFIHPKTKKEVRFFAPWPDDIALNIKKLGFTHDF
jgi:23S rRNA pseudouridine1911/1915/1917 synthase